VPDDTSAGNLSNGSTPFMSYLRSALGKEIDVAEYGRVDAHRVDFVELEPCSLLRAFRVALSSLWL
jgi:hypothetical protein